MVAVERPLVELINSSKSINSLLAREMSGIAEQDDLLKTLLHEAAQSDTLTSFFLL